MNVKRLLLRVIPNYTAHYQLGSFGVYSVVCLCICMLLIYYVI